MAGRSRQRAEAAQTRAGEHGAASWHSSRPDQWRARGFQRLPGPGAAGGRFELFAMPSACSPAAVGGEACGRGAAATLGAFRAQRKVLVARLVARSWSRVHARSSTPFVLDQSTHVLSNWWVKRRAAIAVGQAVKTVPMRGGLCPPIRCCRPDHGPQIRRQTAWAAQSDPGACRLHVRGCQAPCGVQGVPCARGESFKKHVLSGSRSQNLRIISTAR